MWRSWVAMAATLAAVAVALIGLGTLIADAAAPDRRPGSRLADAFGYAAFVPMSLRSSAPLPAPTSSPDDVQFILDSVDIVAEDLGWAAGMGLPEYDNAILRWDGHEWREVETPCAWGWLKSVSMLSATEGWAVGDQILRWDGDRWSSLSPSWSGAVAVSMLDSQLGWAVGKDGYLYRWNGHAWWGDDYVGRQGRLIDVLTLSETEAWAVGAEGLILRWNGVAWSEVDSPTEDDLMAVDAVEGDDAWAVGWNGSLVHWDGARWSVHSSPTALQLRAVRMVSRDAGWAAGQTMLRWDGSSWHEHHVAGLSYVTDLDMVSDDYGWAVGHLGELLHWDGNRWSRATPASPPATATPRPAPSPTPERPDLLSVSMISESAGWAVGSASTALRWDGASWSRAPFATGHYLTSVGALDADDVWAVDVGGAAHRWNGTNWYAYDVSLEGTGAVDLQLRDLEMLDEDTGMAVGSMLVRRRSQWDLVQAAAAWDGSKWRLVGVPDDSRPAGLTGVDLVSRSDGWAVSYHGDVLRWDGEQWHRALEPRAPAVFGYTAVEIIGPEDGWAIEILRSSPPNAGLLSSMMHWNGQAWADAEGAAHLTDGMPLYGMDFLASDDGWAVGHGTWIVHWDGERWSPVLTDYIGTLRSVDMVAPDIGWAVGENGIIMHWDGYKWSVVRTPWDQ